jgi:hypothetical protein
MRMKLDGEPLVGGLMVDSRARRDHAAFDGGRDLFYTSEDPDIAGLELDSVHAGAPDIATRDGRGPSAATTRELCCCPACSTLHANASCEGFCTAFLRVLRWTLNRFAAAWWRNGERAG